MNSKSIPADIKLKSIKEAQTEIKEIIIELEKSETNLEESMDKYNRMMQLNFHIQEQYKMELKKIKGNDLEEKNLSPTKRNK
jgi:exonuclease VII small subunit